VFLLLYSDLHSANIYPFNVKRSKFVISEYSRVDELYSTLAWIATVVKEKGIALPINLGDTFHQALRFYVERYNTTINAITTINKSSTSQMGIVIEGNHDKSDNISAVETLENYSNTTLVNNSIKIKYMSEINSHFVFVPYIRDPEKLKEVFGKLYEKFKKNKSNNVYVFCHIDLKEHVQTLHASSFQVSQTNSYDDLHLDIYAAVFSGHIHNKMKIRDNFRYVGSCLNQNFGDRLEKKEIAILEITSSGYNIEFIKNPYCPLFVQLNLEDEEKTNRKMEIIEEELKKYTHTNVYGRIFALNSDSGRKKVEDFMNKYFHVFTSYEVKCLEDENEITESDMETASVSVINIIDLIIEQGEKALNESGVDVELKEKYIDRLKTLCQLN
jgi:DNA repair exonuclease SbcCD nuclease subunit